MRSIAESSTDGDEVLSFEKNNTSKVPDAVGPTEPENAPGRCPSSCSQGPGRRDIQPRKGHGPLNDHPLARDLTMFSPHAAINAIATNTTNVILIPLISLFTLEGRGAPLAVHVLGTTAGRHRNGPDQTKRVRGGPCRSLKFPDGAPLSEGLLDPLFVLEHEGHEQVSHQMHTRRDEAEIDER